MIHHSIDNTQRKAALIAGLMFLFVIVGSMLYMSFVRPKLILPMDAAATAVNIAAHALLFRAGTTFELLMAAGVIALAWALWVLLKPVDKNLAALALCWRIAEGILWSGFAVLDHAALHIASRDASGGGLEPGLQNALVGVVVRTMTVGMNIVVLFTGLGTIVFSYLLLKSRYVPWPLAAWGVLTYATMILYSCAKLVVPSLAVHDLIVYTPGGIFEVVMGCQLVVIGVRAGAAAV